MFSAPAISIACFMAQIVLEYEKSGTYAFIALRIDKIKKILDY